MTLKDFVGVFVVLGLLGGGYWWFSQAPTVSVPDTAGMTHEDAILGLSFTYPGTYELTEAGPDENGARHLLLLPKSSLPLPENSETPPAITFDIYPKGNYDTALAWIEKSPQSNFVLATGAVQSAELDARQAFFYQWSGLYESESVVFEQKEFFVVASAGGLSADDPTRRDFRALLDTVQLKK